MLSRSRMQERDAIALNIGTMALTRPQEGGFGAGDSFSEHPYIMVEGSQVTLETYLQYMELYPSDLAERVAQLIKFKDEVKFCTWDDVERYLINTESLITSMKVLRSRNFKYEKTVPSRMLAGRETPEFYRGRSYNCWTYIIKAAYACGIIDINRANFFSKGAVYLDGVLQTDASSDSWGGEYRLMLLERAKKFICQGVEVLQIMEFLSSIPRGFIVSFQVGEDKQVHVFLSLGEGRASEFDNFCPPDDSTVTAEIKRLRRRNETDMREIWERYERQGISNIWYCPPPWNENICMDEEESMRAERMEPGGAALQRPQDIEGLDAIEI